MLISRHHPTDSKWFCGECEAVIADGWSCTDCHTILCERCHKLPKHRVPAGVDAGKRCRPVTYIMTRAANEPADLTA